MEAAGAEACTLVSTETSAGHDWIPSAEEVTCVLAFAKRSSVFISVLLSLFLKEYTNSHNQAL